MILKSFIFLNYCLVARSATLLSNTRYSVTIHLDSACYALLVGTFYASLDLSVLCCGILLGLLLGSFESRSNILCVALFYGLGIFLLL